MSNNSNLILPKESSQTEKYNLIMGSPSFFPKIKQKSSINENANDIHDDKQKKNFISLEEYYNYFYNIQQTFDEETINSNNEKNINLKNIVLYQNSKEYIPLSLRSNKEKKEENINIRENTFEYLLQLENLKVSIEKVPEETINHINKIEKDIKEMKNNFSTSNSNYSSCYTSKNNSSSKIISLDLMVKKDCSKEDKISEKTHLKSKKLNNKDIIKKQLRELLNILTKDNYDNIKKQIFEIIKDDIEYQLEFLEIFFPKVCIELEYVQLYAKLCKDLNKELPQKTKSKEDKKNISSIFRTKLVEKCRNFFKEKNLDDYFKEKIIFKKESQLKKLILGNITFITELIKIKLLSKKIIPECINYLFTEYEEEKVQLMKSIDILAILIFFDKFELLINSEKKNLNSKEIQNYKQKIEEIIKKLEEIKNDKDLPRHLRLSIINLIKTKSIYEKIKIEKNEEEFKNKDEKTNNKVEEEITQEYINEKILKDLIQYKNCVENEGNSKNFPWNTTTYLYDIKLKDFADILEGYIISCKFFIEKENNIKYAKNYIKELIEYYIQKMSEEEKIELKNKILFLFAKDLAFETPKIFDIYSYVLYIFIENEILKIKDLKDFIKETGLVEENLFSINTIYKNINK